MVFTLPIGSRLRTSSSHTGWTVVLNQDEEGEIGIKTELMQSETYFQYLLCLGLKCPLKRPCVKGLVPRLWHCWEAIEYLGGGG